MFNKETRTLKDTVEIIPKGGFVWLSSCYCSVRVAKDSAVEEQIRVPLKGNENVRDYMGRKTIIKSWRFIGFYEMTKVYDKHDHLITLERYKKALDESDVACKVFKKTINYDTLGRKTTKHFYIGRLQSRSIHAETYMDKTIIYKGNRIEKVVNRKKDYQDDNVDKVLINRFE